MAPRPARAPRLCGFFGEGSFEARRFGSAFGFRAAFSIISAVRAFSDFVAMVCGNSSNDRAGRSGFFPSTRARVNSAPHVFAES